MIYGSMIDHLYRKGSTRPMSSPNSPRPTIRGVREYGNAGEATIGGSRRQTPSLESSRRKSEFGDQQTRPAEPILDFDYERLDRYQAEGELGRGGWGVVDRVVDLKLDRSVALKRILGYTEGDEDLREQFLHEARITSQLQHPGVVPVHELGDEDDAAYYVMKLLSGETLHSLIRRVHSESSNAGRLEDWVLPLLERFLDVCHTVAYAHHQKILHRDLKPANIMVGSFGETIVLDWGLAKTIEENPEPQALHDATVRHGGDTAPVSKRPHVAGHSQRSSECEGTVVGTPAYMSPEQARGEVTRLDERSDVFALGVILYEILVGTHPHSGRTTEEVLRRAADAERQPLKEVATRIPPPLVAIVETAMARDPNERYADAEELAADVQRWMLGQSVSVHPDTVLDRVSRWCRRNRMLAGVIAASATVMLVLSLAFGVVIKQAHRDETRARQLAEQEKQKAEAAHRIALARMRDARDAADEWLVELSGALEFHPGLAEHRAALLQRAIAHYTRLVEEASESESEQQLEQARLMVRLGDALRLSGDSEFALTRYRNAGAILDRLSEGSDQQVRNVSRTASRDTTTNILSIEQTHVAIGELLSGDSIPTSKLSQLQRSLMASLPFDESGTGDEQQWKSASAFVRLQLACT
ncbi:MAG: serine/threonine-protein kinase, partial [Planctomycetota bacterium]